MGRERRRHGVVEVRVEREEVGDVDRVRHRLAAAVEVGGADVEGGFRVPRRSDACDSSAGAGVREDHGGSPGR